MPEPKLKPDVVGWALIAVAFAVVVALSVLQAMYHLDPHHFGLVFSNAVDLARGRVPYRDVFLQYGILSGVLPASFFAIGGTQLSVVAGIAAFYAIGLCGIYFLTLQISASRRLAAYSLVTAVLVHPLAIYPWPNYLAFPFIVFGALALAGRRNSPARDLVGGILMGLALLCREGLLPPLALSLAALPVLDYWCLGDRSRAVRRLLSWLGFALPPVAFGLYLTASGLWVYWWPTAVDLPKLYTELFFAEGTPSVVVKLMQYLLPVAPLAGSRQFVFGLIVLAAALLCALALWRNQARRIGPGALLLSVLALLLLSSTLHINEVFRLATGTLAGVGLVYIVADRVRAALPVFIAIVCVLLAGFFQPHYGNYFQPSEKQFHAGVADDRLSEFSGQRWTRDVIDYYQWYQAEMRGIASRSCGVKYIRNETRDAYLEAFSPFLQYQLMPFGRAMFDVPLDEWTRLLRPDYDIEERLRLHDMVIVTSRLAASGDAQAARDDRPVAERFSDTAIPADPRPPSGYVELSRRVAPRSFFMPDGLVTLIWVPRACLPTAGNATPG